MINLFNRLYSLAFNDIVLFEKIKLNSFFRYSVRHIANIILPVYLSYSKVKKFSLREKKCRTSPQLIVSLTSFPKRINKLWMVIDILLRQTVKVDKILLYLSKEQFPNEYGDLPKSLLYYEDFGLEIIFVEGDIRSHKKYYYVFKDYPDDLIITVDDDIFYPTTMIETLLYYHQKYPSSIICRYARYIQRNSQGCVLSSSKWKHIRKNEVENKSAFLGTGGGTMFPYPSKCLYKDVLDIKLALQLAPIEDDLWLNTMARLQGTSIIVVKNYKDILPVIISDNLKLFSENGGVENQTDIQLRNVINYYQKFEKEPFK